MKRIYIAGPYSADNIADCLENMRRGMRAGVEVFLAGFAPWVPWHDFHHHLMLRKDESLSIQNYYDMSMAWLEVSDAVLILEGWEDSKGTLAEIDRANELKIPVFYDFDSLKFEMSE
jgi:hypothetical protein